MRETGGRAARDSRRLEVHEFAIVVLLGIGTFKVVDMLNEYVDLTKVQSIFTIALGALIAWALEFSLFAQWEIPVRSEVLGYIGTGLMTRRPEPCTTEAPSPRGDPGALFF
jgi:hypothetical protein